MAGGVGEGVGRACVMVGMGRRGKGVVAAGESGGGGRGELAVCSVCVRQGKCAAVYGV